MHFNDIPFFFAYSQSIIYAFFAALLFVYFSSTLPKYVWQHNRFQKKSVFTIAMSAKDMIAEW